VNHFERLHDKKKKELDEKENHINSGLESLASTEKEVLDLQD